MDMDMDHIMLPESMIDNVAGNCNIPIKLTRVLLDGLID